MKAADIAITRFKLSPQRCPACECSPSNPTMAIVFEDGGPVEVCQCSACDGKRVLWQYEPVESKR